MKIPFSVEEFLNVFKDYNTVIFPFQFFFYIIAIVILFLIFKKFKSKNQLLSSLLVVLWLWVGMVYHLSFFTKINGAAYLFGILFIVEAILLILYGILKSSLSFSFQKSIYNYIGFLLIFYAIVLYPILNYLLGHPYPYSPTFGVPCPTTIFTLGIFLFTNKKFPIIVLIIPFLWSIVGFSAAVNLDMYEDFGLLVAGILSFTLILFRNKGEQKIN